MKTPAKPKMGKSQGISNPVRPQLLALKDAARYLGLTDWALRERVWAGHIPFVRFPHGKKMFFHVPDLEAFIEENKARFV